MENVPQFISESREQNLNPELCQNIPKQVQGNQNTASCSNENNQQIPRQKSKQKSKSPPKTNAKQKDDLEDEMQKYFEEYGVMESIPSSKKLDNEAISPKKELRKQQHSEEQQSNIDQEELYRYKQLENKLNFALNKIEICKDASVKSLKMTTQNSDQMYKRFQYYEKKKQSQIERKKQQRDEEEVRELQKKPNINPITTKIVGNMEPIYERYERVLNQKQKKLQEERQKIKRDRERQEEQYIREFQQRNKRPSNARSSETFYEQLVRWKEKKTEKNKEKLQIQNKCELNQATFQPCINQKSKKLVAKKVEREPIFTREPKVRAVVQQYSFMPKINKKVPNYK